MYKVTPYEINIYLVSSCCASGFILWQRLRLEIISSLFICFCLWLWCVSISVVTLCMSVTLVPHDRSSLDSDWLLTEWFMHKSIWWKRCACVCLKLTSSSLFRVVLFTSPNAMPAFRAANVWNEERKQWERQRSGTHQTLQGRNQLC